MRKAPWKSLVETLNKREWDSPHLDRLAARLDVSVGHRSLEREILEEMAYALRRAEQKVILALERLELAHSEIETATGPDARVAGIEAFNQLREEALRARWELMVHREALGFRRHDEIGRVFPVPPRWDVR